MTPQYFDAMEKRVDSAKTCADLSAVTSELMAELTELQAEVASRISALTPLITLPDPDPGSIVTFLGKLIGPYQAEVASLTAQAALLATKISSLSSLITSKASSLGCSS